MGVTDVRSGVKLMEEALHDDDLAGAMIAVHGDGAAGVARSKARGAAVAGQLASARNWLKVVAAIQQRRAASRA